MTPYDEKLLAEQFDAFLDNVMAERPDDIPAAEASTARALARTAEHMEPDAAFAMQLERRLRTLHEPTFSRTAPRRSWLAALLGPMERVAWVGIMALLIGGFVAGIRLLSEGLPAQEVTVTPVVTAPVTTPLTVVATPRPDATPSNATPVVPPTPLPTPPAPVIIGPVEIEIPSDLLGEPTRYTRSLPVDYGDDPGSVWLRVRGDDGPQLVVVRSDGRRSDIPSTAPEVVQALGTERVAVDASPTRRFIMELSADPNGGYYLSFYDRESGAGLAYEVPTTTSIIVGESPLWSADGTAMLFTIGDALSAQQFVARLTLPSGEMQLWPLPPLGDAPTTMAWLGNDTLMVGRVASGSGTLYRLSLADGTATPLLERPMNSVAVSPDGTMLAMLVDEGEQTNLVLRTLATGQETTMPANGRSTIRVAGTVAWAPDSSMMAVAVNKVTNALDPVHAAWLHVVARDGKILGFWEEGVTATQPMADSYWTEDGEIVVAFSGGDVPSLGRLKGWRRDTESLVVSRNEVGLPSSLGLGAIVAVVPYAAPAATPSPGPLPDAEPLPAPFMAGQRLIVESVSPDGRYVTYREVTEAAWQNQGQTQQIAQGTFHLYDMERQQECRSMAAPRGRTWEAEQALFWMPLAEQPTQFIAVQDDGTVMQSIPCSDEAMSLDYAFAEPPLHLEPLDGEGKRWVVRTASGLALWDRTTLDPIQPIADLPARAVQYVISPDRTQLAVTLLESDPLRESLFVVDVATATARPVATWQAITYHDGTVAPVWVGDMQILVAESADRGPLLLTLSDDGSVETEELLTTRFELPIPPTPEPNAGIAPSTYFRVVPLGQGDNPHLLLVPIGPPDGPPTRLYHPEQGIVEELPAGQVVDGVATAAALLLVRGTHIVGRLDEVEPFTLWRRDIEAIGAEPTLLEPALLPLTWATTLAWSPDGRHILTATTTPGELLLVDVAAGRIARRWQSEADSLFVARWLPDGRAALIQGRIGETDHLWVLPVP